LVRLGAKIEGLLLLLLFITVKLARNDRKSNLPRPTNLEERGSGPGSCKEI